MLAKKKRRKGERKVQEVQVRAMVERGRSHLWTLLVLEEEERRKGRGVLKKIKVLILV